MKTLCSLVALTALLTTLVLAQPPRNGRDDRPPRRPPNDPLFDLFDTNRDGEISAQEIEAASQRLQQLDQDRNGTLTSEELPRPQRDGNRPPRRDDDRDRPQRPGDGRDRPQNNPAIQNTPAGTVLFQGGYGLDRRDGGRPVVLIAAALGVEPEIFRQAFSKVKPARGGNPTPERERANKQVLMAALARHGITNRRLDEVSNYYRYRPQDGGLWRVTPALATAIIRDGKVVSVKLINAGSGYSSAPTDESHR